MNPQPIYVLAEGTQRTTGKSAQENNIAIAKKVADTVRSTLGPRGMDKMLVDKAGDVIITNDGVTILREMEIEHPIGKIMVEIAKTQEEEVGDGTTTAVVLGGELLKQAEELLNKKVHSSIIIEGYHLASKHAIEYLNFLSKKIKRNDFEMLKGIIMTAITGKIAENSKENLADIMIRAIKELSLKEDEQFKLENIKLETSIGGEIDDTNFIKGIILNKEKVHPSMPKELHDCKVALLDSGIEVKKTETNTNIQITDPNQLMAFLEQEENMVKSIIDKLVQEGVNVLFCEKGINEIAQHLLAKNNILAFRRVVKLDMERISKATNSKIISNISELDDTVIGKAKSIIETRINNENMILIEGEYSNTVTILIRGGTEHVVDEVKRAIDDALGDIKTAINYGNIIPGAGCMEIVLSGELRKYAEEVGGKEKMAIEKFAEALEIIPTTLIESSGYDPIDKLNELKFKNEEENHYGVDVFHGGIIDCWEAKIIEPTRVKVQAISSATEVASMILRIDDIIARNNNPNPQNMDMELPSNPYLQGRYR